jgi:hypothetical protein
MITNWGDAVSYVPLLQVELGMLPLPITLFDCTVKFKEWRKHPGVENLQANSPS